MSKTKKETKTSPFEKPKQDYFASFETMDLPDCKNGLMQDRLERVRAVNEGVELRRKLKEIDTYYNKLLKDCHRMKEWQDLSIEMLINDQGELTRL